MASAVRKHGGAVTVSVVLHAGLVALFSLGFDFTPSRAPIASNQVAIQASIVDEALIRREMDRIEEADREDTARSEREEQAALDAARLEREQEQQRLDEARLARERVEQEQQQQALEAEEQRQREVSAEQERARLAQLQLEREAEEARVAEAELARQREAERLQQEEEARLAQQRLEEEARLAREREAEAQRQREAAERQRREEEERQQRLAEQRRQEAESEAEFARVLAAETERRNAREAGLLDEYIRLIQNRIQQNWIRPPSARQGLECEVNVTQIPSGDVIDVRVGRCNGDDAVMRSIEAAVRRASPLPRPSVQALFERNLVVTFSPDN